jgi:hypothetical protein
LLNKGERAAMGHVLVERNRRRKNDGVIMIHKAMISNKRRTCGLLKVHGMRFMLTVLTSGLSFESMHSLFKFWLGFVIRGDYLLSATIMSHQNKRTCGTFIFWLSSSFSFLQFSIF